MHDEQKKDSKEIQKLLKEIKDIISKPNLSDIKDITNAVAEASSIYEKFPDSEAVAFVYVSTLYTLASRLESLDDIRETVDKASSIYEKFPDLEDIAYLYISTLDTLASRQASLDDLKVTVAEASSIYEKFPDSEAVAFIYVGTLNTLARKQESLDDVETTVAKASSIYEKFPDSENIAFIYVSTLNTLASRQESLDDVKAAVAEASSIYEKFPDSEDIASQYVRTLSTLAKSQESLKATVAKASSIYKMFPDSEDVASVYVSTLNTLASKQESLDDVEATVAKVSSIYEKFPDSEDIAYQYVCTLRSLASSQESLDDLKATVAKVSGIYESFHNLKKVAYFYVSILNTLAENQKSLNDLKETVAKASSIYEKFPDSEFLAYLYVLILRNLAESQKNLDDLKATVAKVSGIYEKFPDSEAVAYVYVLILRNLAESQKNLDDLKATLAKASSIYEMFPDSEAVASVYVSTLVYLTNRQETTQNLQETFTKVIDIYNSFAKKEYISSLFAEVISEYINNINFNIPNEQNESAEERLTILFNCIGNDNYELNEYIIDNIFYANNDSISLSKDIVLVLREIFNVVIKLDYLKQTKYAILIELLKDLEDDNREQLIKIYWIVQKIKYELSIKDLSKNKFGHYTSGDVLQILLKQSSDNEGKYSIEERTRLGNVKYMNDPEEGSVLDRYMELGKSDNLEVSLKPSPWFLMSLTTKIDDLAMWSQYGARAEGVCLVLKTDSFKVYKSMAETEWIGNFDISILEKKLTSIKREETNSSNKKDYLYRICYLDEESLNNGDSNVVKEDNNNLLDDEEIKSINTSLVELKQFLNNIAKDSLLNNAIEECLEEIRYLFKVSGYRYESELRILKYAKLDPDNTAIKIDDKSGPVAKLYLERDMPIQLEQVIFGPKFSNPEHVVPLLHLLDKGIELRRSERKFK